MILGVTGTISSGKGKISDILHKLGFKHHSFSSTIRAIARERKIPIDREHLSKLGQQLAKESPDESLIAKRVIEHILKDKKKGEDHFVIEGIRTAQQVRDMEVFADFVLIGVDAPQEMRWERLKKRGREGDPKTFEEFKKIDDAELQGTGGQEVGKTMKMAEFTIENVNGLEDLEKKIMQIIASLT